MEHADKTKLQLIQELEALKLKLAELEWLDDEPKPFVSENKLKTIIDNLNSGLIVHAPDTSITLSNKKAAELLGLTLIGKDAKDACWNFLDEQNHPLTFQDYPINKIIKHKTPIKNMIIGVNQKKNKAPTWLLLNGIPFFNNESEITEVFISFIDITDLRQTEIVSNKNKLNFKTIFEHSPLGISITGIDGSLKINQVFCDIIGYTKDEIAQKHWKEFTHPDDIEYSLDIVNSLIEGKDLRAQYEKRYIHKDGHSVWTNVVTTLKRNEKNEPEYFITFIQDISERKGYELKLEELVNERTIELEQKVKDMDATMKVFVGRELTIRKLEERIRAFEGK